MKRRGWSERIGRRSFGLQCVETKSGKCHVEANISDVFSDSLLRDAFQLCEDIEAAWIDDEMLKPIKAAMRDYVDTQNL